MAAGTGKYLPESSASFQEQQLSICQPPVLPSPATITRVYTRLPECFPANQQFIRETTGSQQLDKQNPDAGPMPVKHEQKNYHTNISVQPTGPFNPARN